ncbi:MAG: cyclase family protein [Candidatus Liptonbacteria bacterium]|nr:cyclase family protein [Candidatus Liptonbacteria bacterium]
MAIKIIDISRPISAKEPIYPGNMPVELMALKKFSKDKSNLSGIKMGLHSGSHIDAPLHYIKMGTSVDKLPLDETIGWCRVVDVSKLKSEIGEKEIKKFRPQSGEILLFKTRNSRLKDKRFNPSFIHINQSGAEVLAKARVKAVGVDGPSVRKFRLKPDTVHPLLLKRGILIYEGLDLSKAKPGRYFFVGAPLKITGAEASPVRAILIKS